MLSTGMAMDFPKTAVQAATAPLPSSSSQKTVSEKHNQKTRNHLWIFLLALTFSALCIGVWVPTCLAVYRPLIKGCPSYDSRCDHGAWHQNETRFRSLRTVATLLNTLTIPVALIVWYRTTAVSNSLLSHDHLFSTLSNDDAPKPEQYQHRPWQMLLFATVFTISGALVFPLQGPFLISRQAYVNNDPDRIDPSQMFYEATIATLERASNPDTVYIGSDPADFQAQLLLSPDVVRGQALDSHIWTETDPSFTVGPLYSSTSSILTNSGDALRRKLYNSTGSWISLQPNSVNTGTHTAHAMRMNSSISCAILPDASSFPTYCSNSNGFSTQFIFDLFRYQSRGISLDVPLDNFQYFQFRSCVPANMSASPWSSNIGKDRQDITEELYLDFQFFNNTDLSPGATPFPNPAGSAQSTTVKCTSTTSMGYFQLPNYKTNNQPGPLLQKYNSTWQFPTFESPQNGYYSTLGHWSSNFTTLTLNDTFVNTSLPGINGPAHRSVQELPGHGGQPLATIQHHLARYHGPLLSSALTLFLNTSLEDYVFSNSIAPARLGVPEDLEYEDFKPPFAQYVATHGRQGTLFLQWLLNFRGTDEVEDLLRVTGFLASITALNVASRTVSDNLLPLDDGILSGDGLWGEGVVRDEGLLVQRLYMPLWLILLDSVLLGVFVVGILGLAGLGVFRAWQLNRR